MVSLRGLNVYLDASTIIYAHEGTEPNIQSGLLWLLDAGQLKAMTSEISLVETIVRPRKMGDFGLENSFRSFLGTSKSLVVQPITRPILEKVIDLRVEFGMKIPDAIHLASGILANCDLFVTGDLAWQKVGVRVVGPSEIGPN